MVEETIFRRWAQPPGKTEQGRCDNAAKAIRNAIKASTQLNRKDIKVFAQGSYRNHTNVTKDSDVDIGVVCYDSFFGVFPKGYTRDSFGLKLAPYQYEQFKNEVGESLSAYFGKDAVRRGNKAFDVRENSYRVEADVAPFFEHRRYHTNGSYLSGVELRPDRGGKVINWPERLYEDGVDKHYEEGVNKNLITHKRFKALVRILKSVKSLMDDAKIPSASAIPGFLVECLVWNVPNDHFGRTTYTADVREVLAYLFNNTMSDSKCSKWAEVSGLKYLFRNAQKWTRQGAHSFLSDAWDCLELK